MVIKYNLEYGTSYNYNKQIPEAQIRNTYLSFRNGKGALEVATAEKDKGEEGRRSRKKEEGRRCQGEGQERKTGARRKEREKAIAKEGNVHSGTDEGVGLAEERNVVGMSVGIGG